MVYDWEAHKDTISHLYVQENKQVDDIIEYMRVNHDFTPRYVSILLINCPPISASLASPGPRSVRRGSALSPAGLPRRAICSAVESSANSLPNFRNFSRKKDNLRSKRAYAAQFRRWRLPSKHQPALKNDRLVARVQELWARNLSQPEMLRVLAGEGFSIKPRELHRVRSQHRWLLRSPSGAGTGGASVAAAGSADAGRTPERADEQGLDGDEVDLADGSGSGHIVGGADEDLSGTSSQQHALDHRLEMEAESASRFASKKRRRRTRQYAGMPADPPGPPRFPSETTLAASQEILGLDRAAYAAARDKFQAICEGAGILKKTVAGPEAWEAAKSDLVAAFPHLQAVMWAGDGDAERKKLALDVICSDVTKRMRAGGDKGLALAEAKNILGLNPAESREVRATLYDILKKDGLTSKVALGPERWKSLKQKWIDESEMLRKILSRLDDSTSYEMKTKAVEAMATDVMKRVRDDQSKRKSEKQDKGKAKADAIDETGFGDTTVDIGGMEDDTAGFTAAMLVPDQSSHSHAHAHAHPPRILANHLVDPQMGMQISMDAQLGAPLLLDPNAQTTFMGSHQQFMPTPAPMTAAPSPFDATPTAAYQATAAATANFIPVYLRELGHGEMAPLGETWIAFLSPAPSLEELRQVAAHKIPGSTCVDVFGLVKMPEEMGAQWVPLQIHDDSQLAAHLAQPGPMFHVRLSF